MRRVYICDNCCHEFEFIHNSIHDPLKKKCPECGKIKLYQDLTGQSTFIYQEPKTIAHQAHRNTERMGAYELQEKRDKDNTVQKEKQENRKRWYNPEGKDLKKSLSDLKTPKQKKDYILGK